MKPRWLVVLLLLAACSPTPQPDDPATPPSYPGCVQVPNTSERTSQKTELGEPVAVVSAEVWYRADLPAGTYTAAFNKLPLYDGFGFFVYQRTSTPVASLFTRDYSDFLTFEFEVSEPLVTSFRLRHISPRPTCETFVFTLVKKREGS